MKKTIAPYWTTEAVAGPGCKIVLVFPHRPSGQVYAPCDTAKINAFADSKVGTISKPTYFSVPTGDLK